MKQQNRLWAQTVNPLSSTPPERDPRHSPNEKACKFKRFKIFKTNFENFEIMFHQKFIVCKFSKSARVSDLYFGPSETFKMKHFCKKS